MSASGSLVITHDELLALVAQRVADILTPATIEKLGAQRIDERIGRLTLEEAAPRLQCRNVRQLRDTCQKYGITIRKLGNKKEWIALADLEAVLKKRELLVANQPSRNGTTIASGASAPIQFPALPATEEPTQRQHAG